MNGSIKKLKKNHEGYSQLELNIKKLQKKLEMQKQN